MSPQGSARLSYTRYRRRLPGSSIGGIWVRSSSIGFCVATGGRAGRGLRPRGLLVQSALAGRKCGGIPSSCLRIDGCTGPPLVETILDGCSAALSNSPEDLTGSGLICWGHACHLGYPPARIHDDAGGADREASPTASGAWISAGRTAGRKKQSSEAAMRACADVVSCQVARECRLASRDQPSNPIESTGAELANLQRGPLSSSAHSRGLDPGRLEAVNGLGEASDEESYAGSRRCGPFELGGRLRFGEDDASRRAAA